MADAPAYGIEDIMPANAPTTAPVVCVTSYIPLHAMNMFQLLQRNLPTLQFLLSQAMQDGRPWQAQFGTLQVTIQKTFRLRRSRRNLTQGWDPPTVAIPISTTRDLSRIKPRVIISLELGFRTLAAWWYRWGRKDCTLIAFVRVAESTEAHRGLLRRIVRRFLLARLDHVIVNGHSGLRHLESLGLPAARATVIPSGTDTSVFGALPAKAEGTAILKILYVGQLVPRKNLVGILPWLSSEIAASGRACELLVAGWGPEKAALLVYPLPSNLTITWLDQVAYHDLPKVYAQADVFFLPSLADEWAMVVNEAMACEVPVLGSVYAQAVSEIVVDGQHGWTFDPTNETSARDALRRMLRTPTAELHAMGRAARALALINSDEREARMIAEVVQRYLPVTTHA